ncbi:MAG: tetratricopeptide repeat protein [Polyangiales bacterium]
MKRWMESMAAVAAVTLLGTSSAFAADEKPAGGKSSVAASMPVAMSTAAGWLKAGADECIASDAKKALNSCSGMTLKRSTKLPDRQIMQADDGGPKKEHPPDKPVEIAIPRPGAILSGKIETALIGEIQLLETQLQKTKVTSDKHVVIQRRLAESYYELERIKEGEVLDLTTKILDAQKKKQDASADIAKRDKAKSKRDKCRVQVNEYYRAIIEKHPDYPKADEVLYYLAYEFEQIKAEDPLDKEQVKQEREARDKSLQVYLELIHKYPSSKFRGAAYLAYGDMYFEDALNAKVEWKVPLEAYDRVIQSGEPPDNKQWGYAQYKKGFIYWNLGQYKDAVTSFKKAIEFGTKFPDIPKAPQIADEARKELIPVYAEYGKAAEAYAFFSPISGDKAGDHTKIIGLLEKLGEEYLGRAHPEQARQMYQDLKGRNPEQICFYETKITEAIIQANPKDKPTINTQFDQLTRTFSAYRDSTANEDKKKQCGNQTAWLMAEHAIAWNYEALGDLGCPPDAEKKAANPKARAGTCNANTIRESLKVYKSIFKTFTSFEGYKFPTKRPEDAPSIPKMRYQYADLLYGQQLWEECGPAFDEVLAMDPTSDVAGDAAFASVLCYQNLYDKEYKGKDKTESTGKASFDPKAAAKVDDSLKSANIPKALTEYQAKMVGAFDRFACFVKPDLSTKTGKDDLDKLVEIKHRRAFIYYEAKHWDEAAEAFREVAISHPDHEYGPIDASYYMDSVVRIYLYADPARKNCGTVVSEDLDRLAKLYCDKGEVEKRLGDKKKAEELLGVTSGQCDRLLGARADLLAIKAQDLAKAEKYEEAADQFAKLASDVCDGAVAQADLDRRATEAATTAPGKKKGKGPAKLELSPCEERGDVYLYNAALNYQRASKIKRAMDIRQGKIIAHESWKDKETYRLTLFDLAEDYRRIALYGRAADWFERFAATDVKVDKLLELAQGRIEKERADHPEKYKDKKIEDVAKEYTEEQRAQALSNAVVLRLGLGQEDEAIRDSDSFDRRFGTKRKEQARQIFSAIGEHYVEKEEWKKGADRLSKFITQFPESRLDEKLHARALAGRAYRELKQNADAEKMFGTIKQDWAAGREKLFGEIEKAANDQPGNPFIRQHAYSAVAEAYLYFADKEGAKAEAVKFEPYKGNGDMPDTEKYFKTKFAPYLKARIEANAPAFQAYQRVLCLSEETTTEKGCTREWKDRGELYAAKFVVEAASKAGLLYADTYDKARNAPLSNVVMDQPGDSPSIKKEKAAVRALYYSTFDRVAEPIKMPARSAFMECLELSTRAKFFDEFSERCEKWLARVYKSEFRTLEELRPTGGIVGTGMKERSFLVDTKLTPVDVGARK